MQATYPHSIENFAYVEKIPDGYVPLSKPEAETLQKKSPAQRAKWLKSKSKYSPHQGAKEKARRSKSSSQS